MIGATKAQLLIQAVEVMTFKEINPTPPLEMGKAICRQTKGALGHSNEFQPKNPFKIPIKIKSKTMN
jgi:hypothetical protein